MAAYVALERINGKSKPTQTPLNVARHNLRCIPAELRGRPGDLIDPKRTKLNKVLRGPCTPNGIVEQMDKTIESYGARVKRKDQIKMFEVVVSPKQAVHDLDGFFEAAVDWLVYWFDCPLLSAVVHLDESEPHMHLLFVPLRDGRLQGDVVMGKRADLARLQMEFQRQIGKRYGLPEQKRYTAKQRASVADAVMSKILRGGLTADEWFQLRKAIETASNIDALASAFGLNAEPEETPIGVATTTAQPHQNPNPYQCVGVQPLALPVEQDNPRQTDTDAALEVAEQQASEIDASDYIREREAEQDARQWDAELGEYRHQSHATGGKLHDEARGSIMRAMPASWSGDAFIEEALRPG